MTYRGNKGRTYFRSNLRLRVQLPVCLSMFYLSRFRAPRASHSARTITIRSIMIDFLLRFATSNAMLEIQRRTLYIYSPSVCLAIPPGKIYLIFVIWNLSAVWKLFEVIHTRTFLRSLNSKSVWNSIVICNVCHVGQDIFLGYVYGMLGYVYGTNLNIFLGYVYGTNLNVC